jgi:SAM-dependent methyltransferase
MARQMALRPTGALLAAVFFGQFLVSPAIAQDFGDTPYVQTPQSIVDAMLDLAKVGPGDYVIDLGSGDGRMVITAAKKHGARGFGVDLDRRLVQLANRNAARAGVSDRAAFYERDLYQTDLREATVVTIYLLPEVNLMVRPKLLRLKPGTRIVSHDYDMGLWRPDQQLVLPAPDKPVGRDKTSKVFFWVVPANAAGAWRWQMPLFGKEVTGRLDAAQNFQTIKGDVAIGDNRYPIENATLRGEDVRFAVSDRKAGARYEFSGRISGNALTGTIRVSAANGQAQLEWDAARTELGTPAHELLPPPVLQELAVPEVEPGH